MDQVSLGFLKGKIILAKKQIATLLAEQKIDVARLQKDCPHKEIVEKPYEPEVGIFSDTGGYRVLTQEPSRFVCHEEFASIRESVGV